MFRVLDYKILIGVAQQHNTAYKDNFTLTLSLIMIYILKTNTGESLKPTEQQRHETRCSRREVDMRGVAQRRETGKDSCSLVDLRLTNHEKVEIKQKYILIVVELLDLFLKPFVL